MDIPGYYLQLSPGLAEYVHQITPGVTNWEQAVFRDITEGGTLLVVEPLPKIDERERLGLCGDIYYCEAGPDWERPDCLFVFKVEKAARRQIKTVPARHSARVYLYESKFSERLSPISQLWPTAAEPRLSILAEGGTIRPESSPSEQLLKLMANVPAEIRTVWRPSKGTEKPLASDELLAVLRKPWTKFRLESFMRLTARQESLLKGLIPNPQLGGKERARLLALFDVDMLNAYARQSNASEHTLFEVLSSLASLPLPQTTRARVWAAIARGLDADRFLRELRGCLRDLRSTQTRARSLHRLGSSGIRAPAMAN